MCLFLLPVENNGTGRGVNNNLSQDLASGTHGNTFLPSGVWRCLFLYPDRAWELAGMQGSCTAGSWDSLEYTMP